MATGTSSSFKIYNEFTHTALIETLTQASNAFNAASRGAIRLVTDYTKGDFDYNSFFQNISGLVSRRTTTGSAALATVADTPLSQGEMVKVKVNRKIGPVANTLDAFKKIQKGPFDEDALNFAVGVQSAKAMQVEMLNTALRALRAALNAQTSVKYTVPSSGTLTTQGLVNGLAKFGDNADKIVCWVMHSKPFYDLVLNQIAANIDGVSNFNVAQATPVTLNRPVLVTDSPALLGGSPTDYYTLGLVNDAAQVEDSEETTIKTDLITGQENLIVRYQGEFAYNVGVRGFTWDVANGGANPSDSALGTGSNWDAVMSSFKDFAGVVIQSR